MRCSPDPSWSRSCSSGSPAPELSSPARESQTKCSYSRGQDCARVQGARPLLATDPGDVIRLAPKVSESVIVINADGPETRVALIENGILTELFIERERERGIVGNVYKGKVLRVLPGMQAAFVDIGEEKAAFLYAGDIATPGTVIDKVDADGTPRRSSSKVANISDLVHPGQEILVQAVKDPISSKGARITTYVSLPGRNVVFLPTVSHIGISRRIASERQRRRLRRIVDEMRPKGGGFIVRTVAQHTSSAQVRAGMDYLIRLWANIKANERLHRAPVALYRDLDLMLRRIAHFCYASLTAKHCRANNIRHLHAHFGQTPATIAWLACEILNRTSDKKTSWSFTIHGFQDFVDDAVARLDLKAASAAFIICISDYTKSQLCRVTDPQFWNRYRVIRCGIDLTAFPMRTEMPDRAVPRIVSVARLSPEKGHLILLNALKTLADEGTHAELQIIGAGPFEAAIRREGERLGLGNRIVYSGELLPADVARELADADVFCLPSFSEGLPVSVMEAMAIGVPVVSTWISGIPELAITETNALIVPASNTEALAGALKRVITDRQLRETLARNARTAVERMHDITNNSEMLLSEFQSVLNPTEAIGACDAPVQLDRS